MGQELFDTNFVVFYDKVTSQVICFVFWRHHDVMFQSFRGISESPSYLSRGQEKLNAFRANVTPTDSGQIRKRNLDLYSVLYFDNFVPKWNCNFAQGEISW